MWLAVMSPSSGGSVSLQQGWHQKLHNLEKLFYSQTPEILTVQSVTSLLFFYRNLEYLQRNWHKKVNNMNTNDFLQGTERWNDSHDSMQHIFPTSLSHTSTETK